MDIKILTVCFGGDWEMKDGDCNYTGDVISKAFVLEDNIELDIMKKLIIERFKINSAPSDISLSHLHPSRKLQNPYIIESDEDLKSFFQINETPKVAWALPLYVSTSKKKSGNEHAVEQVQISSAAIESHQQPSTAIKSGKEHAVEEVQMSSAATESHQHPSTPTKSGKEHAVEEVQTSSAATESHQHPLTPIKSGKEHAVEEVQTSSAATESHQPSTAIESGNDHAIEDVQMSSADIECHQQPSTDISDYQLSSDGVNHHQPVQTDQEREEDEDAEVDLDCEFVQVGQIYPSKKELKTAMCNMAMRENFTFKVDRSTREMYKLKCVDEKCRWKMLAKKLKGVDYFQIRKLSDGHTCPLEVRSSTKIVPTYQTVGEKIKLRFEADNMGPNPNMIRNDVRDEYSQTISYWKAWRAHQWAQNLIRGTPEENYAMLPSYCHMLQKVNNGTYTYLEIDKDNCFKYVFVAIGASIKGFHQMRKVIQVDGTHLLSKYMGFLITASAQDANQQIYPVAYAVVDSENDNSWKWFFEQLLKVVPCSNDLVFVSGGHLSIENAIESVYIDAKHVICTRHLKENLITRFKEKGIHKLFNKAAESYNSTEFNRYFQDICNMNAEMGQYLMEVNFEKWSRANFCGDRYNIMAMNSSESIISSLKDARSFQIVALLEFIRDLLSQWFTERRMNAENNNHQFPAKVREILEERCKKSKRYGVKQLSNDQFEVFLMNFTSAVDLSRRTCSCKMFDLDKIPCTHAIAAIEHMRYELSDYVSEYYHFQPWYMAYQETIYPLPLKSDWDVPEDVNKIVCCPPSVRRKSGRPRKNKFSSVDEITLTSVDEITLTNKRKKKNQIGKCSICGVSGHNKKTCPTKSANKSDMMQVDCS